MNDTNFEGITLDDPTILEPDESSDVVTFEAVEPEALEIPDRTFELASMFGIGVVVGVLLIDILVKRWYA